MAGQHVIIDGNVVPGNPTNRLRIVRNFLEVEEMDQVVKEPSARSSSSAEEIVRRILTEEVFPFAIPISSVLDKVRACDPSLQETDEELIHIIVMDVVSRGQAVRFDPGIPWDW